jgi:hypothetical protein
MVSVGSPRTKNPLDGNKFRTPYSEGSLPHKHNFLKFKHENVIKMKNKPDSALLRPSNLSNEIKKRVPKSRETIPLMFLTIFAMIYTQINGHTIGTGSGNTNSFVSIVLRL